MQAQPGLRPTVNASQIQAAALLKQAVEVRLAQRGYFFFESPAEPRVIVLPEPWTVTLPSPWTSAA